MCKFGEKKRDYTVMMNIAILTGGFSAEIGISLKSADVVQKFLDPEKFKTFQIVIDHTGWYERQSRFPVDKNDFSIVVDQQKIKFDCVFVALHGSPAEDGMIQGYFDMLGLPYTCCNGFVSALTMDKLATKTYLANSNVHMSKTLSFNRGEPIDTNAIESLHYPVFVKPNSVGSSFGVSKVNHREALNSAIEEAFKHDSMILVESFIKGREFGNGVYEKDGNLVVLPITEIIPETDFFDYQAKYEGKSKEVTPADLSVDLTKKCQELSLYLFRKLNCKGFVRFDYILQDTDFYFLEVNTVPGLSEQSIVPQQAVYSGLSLSQFFEIVILNALKK